MGSRGRFEVVALSALLVLGAGVSLTGCSETLSSLGPCGHGSETAADAARGLIDVVRTAKTPEDVCAWISPGMGVSQRQLEVLKSTFAHVSDKSLRVKTGEQMGSEVPVEVTSKTGRVLAALDATADDHGLWTIAYGTSTEAPPTGPTSNPYP